jgi:hypothetical protein
VDLSIWNGKPRTKTLVVLGAGASRGASFVGTPWRAAPPLDADFFSQLQKVKPTTEITALLAFVRAEFGARMQVSMEEFYSQADYTERFQSAFGVDPGRRAKRYRNALDQFHKSLPTLFTEAIGGAYCDYHENIARRLNVEDSIISFNYDCIIDTALMSHAGNRWSPSRNGYAYPTTGDTVAWESKTVSSRARGIEGSITLLKPHGSLNWRIGGNRLKLEENPYSISSSRDRIVPPTWFKDQHPEPYASIWKECRRQVRASRAIIVIGYSVPTTDLFSRALFRMEAGSKEKRQKLDFLVLANPDRSARQRFVEIVAGGIEPTTKILEYDSFQEIAASFGARITQPDS